MDKEIRKMLQDPDNKKKLKEHFRKVFKEEKAESRKQFRKRLHNDKYEYLGMGVFKKK